MNALTVYFLALPLTGLLCGFVGYRLTRHRR